MNGNGKPHYYHHEAFHKSGCNISESHTYPKFVSVKVPQPQLASSFKEGYHSVLNFWSDMENVSTRSASFTEPYYTPPLRNGLTRQQSANARASPGTASDLDSTSPSVCSHGMHTTTDCSSSLGRSEQSSDTENLSATSEIVVPPMPSKVVNPHAIQSKETILCDTIKSREYDNLSVNSKLRLTRVKQLGGSTPILPPQSPILNLVSSSNEVGNFPRTPQVNGYQTMRNLKGNKHQKFAPEVLHFAKDAKPPAPPIKPFVENGTLRYASNNKGTSHLLKSNFAYSFNPSSEEFSNSTCDRSKPIYIETQPSQGRILQIRPASAGFGSSELLHSRCHTPVNGRSSISILGMSKEPCSSMPLSNPSLPRKNLGISNGDSMKSNGFIKDSSCLDPKQRHPPPSGEMRPQNSSKLTFNKSPINLGNGDTTERLSISPNTSDENLVTIRIRPNAEGQYGFNIHGGIDQNGPVVVSRVGDNMPASTTSPRLHIGDQIIRINDQDISDRTQEQIVSAIQKSSKNRSGYLELVVKSNANYLEENVVDDQFPDTGDAPPRPPKNALPETRNSPQDASPAATQFPSGLSPQHLDTSPSGRLHNRYQSQQPSQQQEGEHPLGAPPPPKPRFSSSGAARVKSTSRMSTKKALISDTEALYLSIRDIENGLADGSLVRQFEKLERGSSDATMFDAKASKNISKNRYRDISPYDHSRVRIQGANGDYINASFVNMKIPKATIRKYIASQGPLPTTCADFWQMCWEHNSDLIVMLTSVKEQGRVKCHKYWPGINQTSEYTWTQTKASKALSSSPSSRKCIQLRVSNIKEEVNADTAYREFQVQRIVTTGKDAVNKSPLPTSTRQRTTSFSSEKGPFIVNGSEMRLIVQLQCVSWPDHGVPSNCSDLIDFVERMRVLRDQSNSNCTLVHCSAGIGRTGVLILLDTSMDMIHAHSPVHPIEMVRQIREYREMLIQTSAQFRFACEAIARYYADTILRRPQTKS